MGTCVRSPVDVLETVWGCVLGHHVDVREAAPTVHGVRLVYINVNCMLPKAFNQKCETLFENLVK